MTGALIRSTPSAGITPVIIPLSARQVLAMTGHSARDPPGSSVPHNLLLPEDAQNTPSW